MKRDVAAIGLVLSAAACTPARPSDRAGTVSTADVHRFSEIWRNTGYSSCASFPAYFDSASPGLGAYARKFHVDVDALCAAVKLSPDRYVTVVSNMPAFDSAAAQVESVFIRFRALDSAARMPSVYFIVGNGIAAGTTTRGSDPLILIGAEMNPSAAGLTWTIAHELAHTQQHYPMWGSLTGGPTFLRGTVLRVALTEGSADLIAELLTGRPKHDAYAEEHETALWSDFQREMHSRDYAHWFYNGRNPARRAGPPDLGYWVGYRIAKAYYERQNDKRRAVHDILTIRDFDAFLTASGYDGARPGPLPPPVPAGATR